MAATLPYAYSAEAGCIVHVSSVPRGLGCNCVCQYCEHRLIAKKGQVKEHHFAHYKDNPDCNFENWLHATAKNMLAERINAGSGVDVSWDCADFWCTVPHTATFGVEHSAELERGISEASIRPDITVNKGGETTTYIEVVVSHKPDYPMDKAIARARQ